ncbi:Chromosome segregation in meiosis protein 3 [Yarrowia sp. C11]|nr:Chromosome segregation in meiosis protein 3 [Yarrowia sp. E02]KAG5371818.1 Chromosome segregation in meiosis protein 3 [Yarrowia sp. C11]
MDNEYESPWGLTQETRTDSQPFDSQPLNDDELGINTEVQVKRSRHVAKLDDNRLLEEKGLPALKHLCTKMHLKGHGHEVGDLGRLLDMYQMWSHDLFPKGQFKGLYPLTSKAGRSASVRNLRLAWIQEEQDQKKFGENAVSTELDDFLDRDISGQDVSDFRDRGRHFESETRYSRQSQSGGLDDPEDNPDDLFVGMDSVDHRLVSDEDVDIQAEVSRREEEEDGEQDVSELLEGARAQREKDNSRSSGRLSLFDMGEGGEGGEKGLEGDIFGTGSLAPLEADVAQTKASEPSTQTTGSSTQTTTEPPSTQTKATTEPSSTQSKTQTQASTQPDLNFMDDFEPEDENPAQDYDDEDEMEALREFGF